MAASGAPQHSNVHACMSQCSSGAGLNVPGHSKLLDNCMSNALGGCLMASCPLVCS